MLNIKNWMDRMRLKMNPSKTEFIYFGFNRQLAKCNTQELKVAGDLIPRTDLIQYLGVWLDAGTSLLLNDVHMYFLTATQQLLYI